MGACGQRPRPLGQADTGMWGVIQIRCCPHSRLPPPSLLLGKCESVACFGLAPDADGASQSAQPTMLPQPRAILPDRLLRGSLLAHGCHLRGRSRPPSETTLVAAVVGNLAQLAWQDNETSAEAVVSVLLRGEMGVSSGSRADAFANWRLEPRAVTLVTDVLTSLCGALVTDVEAWRTPLATQRG